MLDTTTTAAPDWDRIKADFEAGAISVREIARREGISDTAIWKKSKSEAWNAGLRKPAELPLPGAQTDDIAVQTKPGAVVITGTDGKVLAEIDTGADDFKWEPENKDILITETKALAIYMNAWDKMVLRQDGGGTDDDSFVYVDIADVPALIKRLEALSHGA
jgi:hypothetical protein